MLISVVGIGRLEWNACYLWVCTVISNVPTLLVELLLLQLAGESVLGSDATSPQSCSCGQNVVITSFCTQASRRNAWVFSCHARSSVDTLSHKHAHRR